MKINNQLPSFNTITNTPQNVSDGFMKLLDELQHSLQGDEYYWQHQDQLQQSQLTFAQKNPKSIPKTFRVTSSAKILKIEREESANKKLVMPCSEQVSLKRAFIAIPQSHILNEQYGKVLNSDYEFIVAHTTAEKPMEQIEELLKETNPLEHSKTSAALNKHHLYIDQQEAELSINTYELKPKEQKQLMHMIKSYLKKKGWSLKKLMINGVSHD